MRMYDFECRSAWKRCATKQVSFQHGSPGLKICHSTAFGRHHFTGEGWLLMVQCCINTWVVSLADGTGEEGVKTIELNMLEFSDLDQFCSLLDSFIFHIILPLADKWHTWSFVSHLNFIKKNVGFFCIFPSWSWWQTKEEAFSYLLLTNYLFLNSPEIFPVPQLLLKISHAAATMHWHDSKFLLSNGKPVPNVWSFFLLQKKWTIAMIIAANLSSDSGRFFCTSAFKKMTFIRCKAYKYFLTV